MMNAPVFQQVHLQDRSKRFSRRAGLGQALVETSILAPVLIFILVGIVDFGRVLMVQHAVTSVARQGARVASVGDQSTSSTSMYEKVRSSLTSKGLDPSQATVTISGINAASGQPTEVAISYPVTLVILDLIHTNSAINISATSRMRHE
jgi:Flp pilus assembly protein TadG